MVTCINEWIRSSVEHNPPGNKRLKLLFECSTLILRTWVSGDSTRSWNFSSHSGSSFLLKGLLELLTLRLSSSCNAKATNNHLRCTHITISKFKHNKCITANWSTILKISNKKIYTFMDTKTSLLPKALPNSKDGGFSPWALNKRINSVPTGFCTKSPVLL